MEQIVYTSRATDRVTAAELFKIIEVSARNNPARDVTGFLLVTQGAFLQMIEGPSERLDQLLTTLQRDPRHKDIEVMLREPIGQRDFPSWKMQRFDISREAPVALLSVLRDRSVRDSVLDVVEGFLLAQRKAT